MKESKGQLTYRDEPGRSLTTTGQEMYHFSEGPNDFGPMGIMLSLLGDKAAVA